MQEAGDKETARLYRGTDTLGVIASVAPLLGLLGTVQGMIGAFEGVAGGAVNDAAYYESLASNISLALITTFQGLVVAIPCTAAHAFLRNRIEAIAAEAGEVADEFAALVERSQAGGP
jgi:biopolymer transport protein ExbB